MDPVRRLVGFVPPSSPSSSSSQVTAPVPIPATTRRRAPTTHIPDETPTGSLGSPTASSPPNRVDTSSEISLEMSGFSLEGREEEETGDLHPYGARKDFAAGAVGEESREVVPLEAQKTGSTKLKERMSKAERRTLQEAQRAAKAAAKIAAPTPSDRLKLMESSSQRKNSTQITEKVASSEKNAGRLAEKHRKKDVPLPRLQYDDKGRVEKAKKRAVVKKSETGNRVELFRHLPQYVNRSQLPDLAAQFFVVDAIHPSIYKVGLQYISGDITGGNDRCIAMLLAFKDMIKDFSAASGKVVVRDLAAKIGSCISFLIECRPLSIGMGNAIRFLKARISKIPVSLSESEVKVSLEMDIDHFINKKIIAADNVITEHAITKISNGDVLLTYGFSCIIEKILLSAHECGKHFRVIIVDSHPKFEGQRLLQRLVSKGLSCTYTHLNALSYIMHEVTRVFLGASSVLSNGTVYSRIGTACVAMVAHAFIIPVLICCEAYKFHNRVQLDSICFNELGDPDSISKVHGRDDVTSLDGWVDNENLQLLNLNYDATPSDYVSMIITEYGRETGWICVKSIQRDNPQEIFTYKITV